MKTAISIPDDLFETAEKAAKRLGLSRSQLYQRAISAFLKRHDDRLTTEALDAIYAAEPERSALDPLLEQLQVASISPEEW